MKMNKLIPFICGFQLLGTMLPVLSSCGTPDNEWTVTFDLNGGSGELIVRKVKKGEKISNIPSNPMRDGFSFKGWSTSKDEYKQFDFNLSINNNLTLYASWQDERIVSNSDEWYEAFMYFYYKQSDFVPYAPKNKNVSIQIDNSKTDQLEEGLIKCDGDNFVHTFGSTQPTEIAEYIGYGDKSSGNRVLIKEDNNNKYTIADDDANWLEFQDPILFNRIFVDCSGIASGFDKFTYNKDDGMYHSNDQITKSWHRKVSLGFNRKQLVKAYSTLDDGTTINYTFTYGDASVKNLPQPKTDTFTNIVQIDSSTYQTGQFSFTANEPFYFDLIIPEALAGKTLKLKFYNADGTACDPDLTLSQLDVYVKGEKLTTSSLSGNTISGLTAESEALIKIKYFSNLTNITLKLVVQE